MDSFRPPMIFFFLFEAKQKVFIFVVGLKFGVQRKKCISSVSFKFYPFRGPNGQPKNVKLRLGPIAVQPKKKFEFFSTLGFLL